MCSISQRTEGANTMLYTLEGLQNQQLIEIHDGAVVTWPAGASKPKTKQLSKSVTTGAGALGGAFWGFLFGLLFFIPIFGLAVGAAIGALMGHFSNYGIDQGFIDQVRSKITPGTSALFLLETGWRPGLWWTEFLRRSRGSSSRSFRQICPKSKKTSCAPTSENSAASIDYLLFKNCMPRVRHHVLLSVAACAKNSNDTFERQVVWQLSEMVLAQLLAL